MNTQFCKQSILGKPPSSSGSKLYAVTSFQKSKGLPKIDKTHALLKPATSNSVPTLQESKVTNNDKCKFRTNRDHVLQPLFITKKDVNPDSNGLSSTGVDNTAKTRRQQPRSNTKNDKMFLGTVHFRNDHVAAILAAPRTVLAAQVLQTPMATTTTVDTTSTPTRL
ncbi:hypothetical protein Tco_0857953 [Tanacetum coccineum]|uniref:Uncharacterized protein n=1 Tax=Tanacetum coccineum TaxID=301880 RepID=A0ABQ5B7N9_9ASTR